MSRYSQRQALTSLSEINITPLLDLAFVLLIIFMITTPLLENSANVIIPSSGGTNPALDAGRAQPVSIDRSEAAGASSTHAAASASTPLPAVVEPTSTPIQTSDDQSEPILTSTKSEIELPAATPSPTPTPAQKPAATPLFKAAPKPSPRPPR